MCGICGITKQDANTLAAMQQTIAHRGPDGSGSVCEEGISLGHQRLSVIDLSEAGAQPMHSTDGRYIISYNGEIYNYQELKQEIGDRYTFSSESDTEVLLAAYTLWGTDMLSKLRGIFAFALWDRETRTLTLCRDPLGVKPLYYTFKDDTLYFSSELSGLRAVAPFGVSQKSLALYFGINYVPGAETMVSGVYKLSPGTFLTYHNGELKQTIYFSMFQSPPKKNVGHANIYETIDRSVARQLVSDRPVGVFLSGGIDSSVVLHHASQHADTVRTFSVDFEMVPGAESETEKFNSDARLAEQTAAHYGATHTTFSISIDDVRTNLEVAIQAMDEPVANPTAISQYLLSKWVRDAGVVVALGGDGGDELFGGYTRHRAMMAAYWYQQLPAVLRRAINPLHKKLSKLNMAPGLPLHLELMVNDTEIIRPILKQDFKETLNAKNTCADYFAPLYDAAPKDMHILDQFMQIDRRTWLVEESLARSDRSSMAHGLELRVPLLDVDVVALSDTISPFAKTTPWQGKKILRDAYRPHLPLYLYQQPKRGWISPGAKWLRDPHIEAFCREVFSSAYFDGLDDMIDWPAANRMYDDHIHKRGYYLQPLWNLLVLQVWGRKNAYFI